PKEQLSAYERWELGSLSESDETPQAADAPAQAPQETVSEAELERIKAEAREAGYAAGLAEGRKQAKQEVERLANAAAQAEWLLGSEAEQFAAEILDPSLELARQMVRTELKVRRETLLAVVREA